MRKILKFLIIPALMLTMNAGSQLLATDLSELNPYLKKISLLEMYNTSTKIVPLNIYYSGGDTGPDGAEVIVYLKNSAWDRDRTGIRPVNSE